MSKKLYTIPKIEEIRKISDITPKYMYPQAIPHACVAEGALSDETCDAIIEEMNKLDPYGFHGCEATTRECTQPLHRCLSPITEFLLQSNSAFWRFELDEKNPAAWFQTYEAGEGYQVHRDGELGQQRKLTTVALLSSENQYEGGYLRLIPYPEYHTLPRTRGTMVTFPSWMLHDVTRVSNGVRQTINLGMFGPAFR